MRKWLTVAIAGQKGRARGGGGGDGVGRGVIVLKNTANEFSNKISNRQRDSCS